MLDLPAPLTAIAIAPQDGRTEKLVALAPQKSNALYPPLVPPALARNHGSRALSMATHTLSSHSIPARIPRVANSIQPPLNVCENIFSTTLSSHWVIVALQQHPCNQPSA
jgi:hypothetical protein